MPTFAEALTILDQNLKYFSKSSTSKFQILKSFTADSEDCILCKANLEYGLDQDTNSCSKCPASFSTTQALTPCLRVISAHKQYTESTIRKDRFLKIFSEALAETNYNFKKMQE